MGMSILWCSVDITQVAPVHQKHLSCNSTEFSMG